MAINITWSKKGYEATVSPPHCTEHHWQSSKPIDAARLIAQLIKLGCHQTDIGDAMYVANPKWLRDIPTIDKQP